MRLAWAGLAVLTVLSVWWNAGFAVLYQREYGYLLTNAEITQVVDFRVRASTTRFPAGRHPESATVPSCPSHRSVAARCSTCTTAPASTGRVAGSGARWLGRMMPATTDSKPFSRVPATTPRPPSSRSERPARASWSRPARSRKGPAQFELFKYHVYAYHLVGPTFAVPKRGPIVLDVVLDHDTEIGQITRVRERGRSVLTSPFPQDLKILSIADPIDRVTIGKGVPGIPTTATFPGTLRSVPVRSTLCKRVVSDDR